MAGRRAARGGPRVRVLPVDARRFDRDGSGHRFRDAYVTQPGGRETCLRLVVANGLA